ncbi:MAG: LysR family transcriptional regulator [Kiloniellaceae bacterium]
MSIRHLRTLIAIAESGSFAAAAERVFVTQAAVSMQVKSLEDELGVTLFDRGRRPPELSEAGRALVPKAIEIVRAYDRLRLLHRDFAGIEGDLRLGAVPTTLTGITPRALAAMRSRYPRLHVDLSTGASADLVHLVERGHLDTAIISDLPQPVPGLAWEPFLREPLIVIAPMSAPEVPAEELLATLPFIRFSRSAWVGRLIDETLRARGIRVREFMTLDTLEAIGAMVFQGLGVSLVPHRRVGTPFPLPVRHVTLAKPTVYRVLGLVRREAHPKANLIEALSAELSALADAGP